MSTTEPIYTDPAYIDTNMLAFPGNVVRALEVALESIPDIEQVVRRPLHHLDPTWSVGITALSWSPGSTERDGSPMLGGYEPTLGTYAYAIQALVRHADPIDGLGLHGLLTKAIRAMLYRNGDLRLALASLTETSFGVTERLQRWSVASQRYASNEIEGEWYYLSTTELQVTTETVTTP